MANKVTILSHNTVDYVVKVDRPEITDDQKRDLVKTAIENRDFSWGSGAAEAIRLRYALGKEVGPKVINYCWNIPDDFPGKELMRLFEKLNISTEHVQVIPGSTSRQNLILVKPDGAKYFVRIDDGQGLLDIPINFPKLDQVKVVVNQCLSSLVPSSFEEEMRDFREEARNLDIITNYAINSRIASVSKIVGDERRIGLLQDSIPSTHTLFASFEELDMACRGFNIKPDYQFKQKGLDNMIEQAIKQAKYLRESWNVERVYILMGPHGFILQTDQTIRIDALPLREGETLIGAGTGDAVQIMSAAQPFYRTSDGENLIIQAVAGYEAAKDRFNTPEPNFRERFFENLDGYAREFYRNFEKQYGIDHDDLTWKVKHPSTTI
jgi:sugar/nucleoside kinase (ribokinase family)